MVDPDEMSGRARRAYERRKGGWVRSLVADGLARSGLVSLATPAIVEDVKVAKATDTALTVNLAPPTRRDVLRDMEGVGAWVRRWESYGGAGEVIWEERHWASVGTQRIPVRVHLADADAIARASNRADEWSLLASRARDLVRLAEEWGGDQLPEPLGPPTAEGLPDAARRLTPLIASTSDGDWKIVQKVLRWLGRHRGLSCYVREIPVRGIDTKWIERHGKLVLGLAQTLYGLDALPFKRPPELIRVRALGPGVLPEGFEYVSLTFDELASLDSRPPRVVVCENLISVLTMPPMEGTLALFGAGYGVGSRLAIPWLDDVDLHYWGDVDTHGFRILDGFRKHHPRAVSILMDERTLDDCRDLWVEERDPFTGELARLTDEEARVFEFLRRQSPTPRLEQERIPYEMVRERFASLPSGYHAAF